MPFYGLKEENVSKRLKYKLEALGLSSFTSGLAFYKAAEQIFTYEKIDLCLPNIILVGLGLASAGLAIGIGKSILKSYR